MNYFVLGGTGFIGSAVVKELLKQNHHVVVLEHRKKTELSHPNLSIVKGSLDKAAQLLSIYKPNIIIHLARISGGRYAIGRYLQSVKAKKFNHQIRHYLEENPQTHLYYLSGSLMYGNSSHPLNELSPMNPISFAKQYAVAERPFVINPPLNCTVLRPGWVFGKGSWFYQFYLKPIQNQHYVPQYGSGENKMTIIHVNDLSKLVILYAQTKKVSPVYNLYSPILVSQASFVIELAEISKKEINALSSDEVLRKFNRTIQEAFESNIVLASTDTSILDNFDFEYANLRDLLLSEIK